jgi:hypothetical protein
LPGPTDPNLYDVFWIAKNLRAGIDTALPTEPIAKVDGVSVVECVEKHFIQKLSRQMLVRLTPAGEVGDHLIALAQELRSLLPFSDKENLIVSLYAWHGCIHMAKTLRAADVRSTQYTLPMRYDGHEHIKGEWTREEAMRNPWVRYGVSLARHFEMGRKKENFASMIHEDWVPQDSPYWEI